MSVQLGAQLAYVGSVGCATSICRFSWAHVICRSVGCGASSICRFSWVLATSIRRFSWAHMSQLGICRFSWVSQLAYVGSVGRATSIRRFSWVRN